MGRGFFLFLAIVFCSITPAHALQTKREQITALETILSELKTHYGMIRFKEEAFGVDYDSLREKYRALIKKARTLEEEAGLHPPVVRDVLPPEEFRQLMIGLAAEFRDGHTNILRQTTQMFSLGLKAAAIDGRLYVTGFRKNLFNPAATYPRIRPGDEILELDGVPVQEIAAQNLLYMQRATYRTRSHGALEMVVNVSHRFLRPKEVGTPATLKLRRPATKTGPALEFTSSLHWMNAQDVDDLQIFSRYLHPKAPEKPNPEPYAFGDRGSQSYFLLGLKNLGLADGAVIDLGELLNLEIRKARQAKEAKLPHDKKLAEMEPVARMPVYLVRYQGKNLGVLRVPDYHPEKLENELKWLSVVIPRLEGITDTLIIDQVSNGGGYVYHMARLVSHFAAKTPLKLGTLNAKLSDTFLHHYSQVEDPDDSTTKEIYGDRPTFVDLTLHKKTMEELRRRFQNGEQWSGPLSFYGHGSNLYLREEGEAVGFPKSVYTKPVLILNDQRSGSGGDFMPAVMQANGRAVVFGETSMGLGGPVYRGQESMPGSEMSMRCTLGFCLRADGLPIENLGVVPDVERPVTIADLRGKFTRYSKDALEVALKMVRGEKPRLSSRRRPATHRSLVKLEDLVHDLRDSVRHETSLDKTIESYHTFFRSAGELGRLKALSPVQWRALKFPLPAILKDADVILRSLRNRDEIIDRLADLRRLPKFRELSELLGLLQKGLSDLGSCRTALLP